MFLVSSVKKELGITILGLEEKLPLVWSEGMVGAMPVFHKRSDAEAYAVNTGAEILEIQFSKEVNNG